MPIDFVHPADSKRDELLELLDATQNDAAIDEWIEKQINDKVIQRSAELFRHSIFRVLTAMNPQREAFFVAMACGMECVSNHSVTDVAKAFNVSKQFVSRRMRSIMDEFGLTQHRATQSMESREIQQHTQLKKHSKEHLTVRSLARHDPDGVLARFKWWLASRNKYGPCNTWDEQDKQRALRALSPIRDFVVQLESKNEHI